MPYYPPVQSPLTFGIANTNAVKIDDASVADDEYAKFTANGLESRSYSEVLSDIGAVGKTEVLYAEALLTSNQTLATSTTTTIVAMLSISGDMSLDESGGVVIPTGNFYANVSCGARYDSNATGVRISIVAKNSTNMCVQSVDAASTAGVATAVTLSTIFPVTSGDVVYLKCAQNSGGNLDVTSAANFTFIRIVLIPYA